MSRFGWAYVNDVITGSGGGTPGGSDKAIQFASGSTFSGSTNFTFDYNTNTVRLTGTLYADSLIVSSSIIYKSGSTKFGDDSTDTHQFTGSLLLSSSYISQADYIDFNVAASAPSHRNGRVYWNNTDGCLDVYNAEADVTLQVGQENWTRIFNDSGVLISNGTAVRLNGTHGDVPTAVKAQSIPVSGAVNIYNQILGLATHDIEVNSFGYITTQGLVRGLNTNAFNDGDMLFVSTSAGLLTNTPPTAPYEIIPIGVCVKASPGTSGIIYVAVQQPTDFSDLSSVYVSGTYHYGDLLSYVSSSTRGYWTHTNQLSGAYGVTGSINVVGIVNATSNIASTGGVVSASVGLQTAGGVTAGTNVTATGGILSSSAGVQTAGAITSQSIISSSLGFQTNSTITAANNITSTSGLVSASNGVYSGDVLNVAGVSNLKNNLIVTGNVNVSGTLVSTSTIQAAGFIGDGLNITGIEGSNVYGVGNDWTVQFKDGLNGTLTGSANLTFNSNVLSSSAISASSYVGPIPKHAIFAASGITTGSFYELRTINANKYLQLQRRKTFPIARSIGTSDSEYGWVWLNRGSLSGSSNENITVVSGANFVHSQSSDTTWYAPNYTAPVRYKSYGLAPGQTLQVIAKIAATGSQNFESTQILAWISGSNAYYVRTGPAYDTGIKIATQYAVGGAGTNNNVAITSAERASGIWLNLTITEDTFVLYHYTGSSGLTPPTSGWEFNVCSTFSSTTTYGKKLNVGQMIMSGRAGANNSTGSFLYYDVSVTDQTDYLNPVPYVRWGATQYDTSGTEQLIGEFDLGSSSTVNQTVLRQVLADLENNIEGDTATVTWSAVQSNSSGASSGTFYSSSSVVISGSGRYFRLWVKITSNGNQAGSIGPFPIVIPIS